jgi:uncharacterized protein
MPHPRRHNRSLPFVIVPAEQSRAVADAAPNLRQLVAVEGADHNDPALLDGDLLINAVVALADHAGQKP